MATPPIPPRHEPVMLDEIVAMLAPVLVERDPTTPPILVDCTLGLGGHAVMADDFHQWHLCDRIEVVQAGKLRRTLDVFAKFGQRNG